MIEKECKGETAYLSFFSPVTQQSADALVSKCSALSSRGVKTIYIAISTNGGDVQCGITIYNMLMGFPCEIVMHNVSAVNSVGTVLFCAGARRYANRNSSFMFHGVVWNESKPVASFDEKFLKEKLESIASSQSLFCEVLSQRTKIKPDEIRDMFFRQVTRSPEYAAKTGLIHEIKEFNLPANCHLVRGDVASP